MVIECSLMEVKWVSQFITKLVGVQNTLPCKKLKYEFQIKFRKTKYMGGNVDSKTPTGICPKIDRLQSSVQQL